MKTAAFNKTLVNTVQIPISQKSGASGLKMPKAI